MRTPKEIKDALDLCISEDKPCTTCAYNKFRASKSCMDMMLNDARNCICESEPKALKWVSIMGDDFRQEFLWEVEG